MQYRKENKNTLHGMASRTKTVELNAHAADSKSHGRRASTCDTFILSVSQTASKRPAKSVRCMSYASQAKRALVMKTHGLDEDR